MLTEQEVDALARELLTDAIREVRSWDKKYFDAILQTDDGELIPVYSGTSPESLGSFVCEFMALAAIKRIIHSCELSFDTFEVTLSNKDTGEEAKRRVSEMVKKGRADSIKYMARWASVNLIGFFPQRLHDCLDDAVTDCGIIANALLAAVMAEAIVKSGMTVTADARADIEKAAAKAAEKKRETLRGHIDGLPHLLTKKGRGAPIKSPQLRKLERDAYAARVETAYREVRAREGKKPTKISVATELGAGGINPAKGSDTRLTAFGNKLRSLKIDYEAIASKVESELHE